jgi:hypothetical protein
VFWTLELDFYCGEPSGNVFTVSGMKGDQKVWEAADFNKTTHPRDAPPIVASSSRSFGPRGGDTMRRSHFWILTCVDYTFFTGFGDDKARLGQDGNTISGSSEPGSSETWSYAFTRPTPP